MAEAVRLFVAIELTTEVKKALQAAQRQLQAFSRDVRWAAPEQMHLTVKFLGDTPDDQAEAVCGAAAEIASQVSPFNLELEKHGCFPPRGAVRIVHRAVAPNQALQHCSEFAETAYEALGFPREHRPFSPHLTIGRVRQDGSRGALRRAVEDLRQEPVGQPAEGLVVVRSELGRGGARYSNIVEHRFTGSR